MRTLLAGAALAGVVSATLWGAAGPAAATADEPAAAPASAEPSAQPQPPTARAESAAHAVQNYLENTPKPVWPGPGGSTAEREAYGPAALRWMQEFPFAAGMAQWNCTALRWSFELVPNAEDGPDHVNTEWVFECLDGYFPPLQDIFAARPDALDTAAAPVLADPLDCLTIRDGWHCFSTGTDPVNGSLTWNQTYYWQGSGSMTGRYRIGSVPAVWPACSEGAAIRTGLVVTLEKGVGSGFVSASAPGTVKSLSWYETDANGNNAAQRSVRCLLEPTSASGEE
jgi:hypothetical protein